MNKILFLITLLTTISLTAMAQENSVLSEKHRQELESVTDSTERAKLYEKYLEKDIKKQAKKELKRKSSKEANKLATQELSTSDLVTDSLTIDSAAVASEVKQEGTKQLQEQTGVNIQDYNYLKRDSTGLSIDSTAVANEVKKEGAKQLQQQTGVNIEEYNFLKKDSTGVSIDSAKVTETVKTKGEQLLKNTDEYKAMSGMEGSDLDNMMEYQEQIEQTQEELQQMAAQDELKKQMTSKAKDYIMQNVDQIQQVQGQMTELKAKYSSVPNSNDLSTATKRSSLKGEPIWKRFFFGLNFSVPSLSPFTMNLAPQLGYRIDKRFDVGVSGTYKVVFKQDANYNPQREEVYGYSVFADYVFYRNFFAYIEGERMNSADPLATETERSWKESLLVGVGRKFNITKWLEMNAIVTYNFLHDNRDGLYSSPVVFKTGFRVKSK